MSVIGSEYRKKLTLSRSGTAYIPARPIEGTRYQYWVGNSGFNTVSDEGAHWLSNMTTLEVLDTRGTQWNAKIVTGITHRGFLKFLRLHRLLRVWMGIGKDYSTQFRRAMAPSAVD